METQIKCRCLHLRPGCFDQHTSDCAGRLGRFIKTEHSLKQWVDLKTTICLETSYHFVKGNPTMNISAQRRLTNLIDQVNKRSIFVHVYPDNNRSEEHTSELQS